MLWKAGLFCCGWKINFLSCEIWGSCSSEYDEYCPLGCDVVYCGRKVPVCQRNLPPSPPLRWKCVLCVGIEGCRFR